MRVEVKVPQLPESVPEATLVGWHPTDKRGKALSASCTAEYTVPAYCSRIAG